MKKILHWIFILAILFLTLGLLATFINVGDWYLPFLSQITSFYLGVSLLIIYLHITWSQTKSTGIQVVNFFIALFIDYCIYKIYWDQISTYQDGLSMAGFTIIYTAFLCGILLIYMIIHQIYLHRTYRKSLK